MSLLLIRVGLGIAITVGGALAIWLSKRRIDNSYHYSEPVCSNDLCSICLVELNQKWQCVTLNCQHVFHKKCAQLLFNKGQKRCPVCRTFVNDEFIRSTL